MTDRPIIMSGPMVRALLAGRKTQTRRLASSPLAKTEVGDRLYVREAHAIVPATAYRMSEGVEQTVNPADPYYAAIYTADWERSAPKWKPSIHMPRWANRLTLTVTEVRFQRLQEISEADAVAESCTGRMGANPDFPDEWDPSPIEEFRDLWNSLHDKPGERWEDSPEIVALTFDPQRRNIDAEAA